MLITRPSTGLPALDSLRQCSAAWRVGQKVPRRCTRITVSQSSSERLTSMRSRSTPALLTRASSRPNSSSAVAMRRAAPSVLATSSPLATARPPKERISSTTSWAGAAASSSPSISTPRSFTTTAAPWRASSSAWQRPKPRPPPVTMATRPSLAPLTSRLGLPEGEGDAIDLGRERDLDPQAHLDVVDGAPDDVRHHARPLIELDHGHDVGNELVEGGGAALVHDRVGVDGAPPARHLPARLTPAGPAERSRMELRLLALLTPLDDQLATGGGIPERLGGAVGCRQDPAFDGGIGFHDFSLPSTTVPMQESWPPEPHATAISAPGTWTAPACPRS